MNLISLLKKTIYFFAALACLWLFIAILLVIVTWDKRKICAQLPNGLLFGSESIIRSQRPFGTPISVFKRPDGSVLIADATSFLHISKTTIYGLAYVHKADGKKNYRFAYRPDVGLVIKKNDPQTFARLVAEAGPALEELINEDGRTEGFWLDVQYALIRSPKYRRTDCPIAWYS